jgi:N12 class adenine-specific DNA methylase
METIIKSEKFKKIEKEAEQYSQEMSKNLVKAKNTFIKIKEDISKRSDWDNKKKGEKIQELYDYILEKLYSKEEVEQFKKMMNMIMIIPNGKQYNEQADLIIE